MKLELVTIIGIFIIINSIILASAQPDYFDWRDNNGDWMTPVKHQYACGSCWAHSAVGTFEAQYNIAKNDSTYDLNLSEQQLVSNCSDVGACAGIPLGGWPNVFEYLKNSGVVNETCFPYVDSNCPTSCGCTYGCSNAICSDNQCKDEDDFYKIDDYVHISSNKETIKNYLVNKGPLSIIMNMGGAEEGANEIWECDIDWSPDHAMIITGYNETGDYWIVKNSWGLDWPEQGDDGYFKVGFDECGIETLAYGVNLTLCSCTNWTAGSCGGGSCSPFQKQYTRTCTPTNCSEETKCEYDESCIGGQTITVCKAGAPTCDYSTIQDGLDAASDDDLVKITDEAVYEEDINWSTSDGGVLLNCQGATITSTWWAITIHDKGNIAIINCVINASSGIDITGTGYGYEFLNNVFDIDEKAIELNKTVGDANDINDNLFINANEQAVYFNGDSSDCPNSNNLKRNDFLNNRWAIYLRYSRDNVIMDNVFEDSIYYGIYFQANGESLDNTVENNNFTGNEYGVYISNQKNIVLTNNTFCPSNSAYDIYTTHGMTGNSGTGNRCEKPDSWNDSGVLGCTYYCDTPAEVDLLYPPDGSVDTDGDVELVCQSTDNYNLVNVTLYHNITGTWQVNETKNISGTSNITTFSISGLNDTIFIWNCLAYDNRTRGGFADANWSVGVEIPPNDTSKFYHKNSSGNTVAWLGNEGNIVLKGSCYSGGNCDAPGNGSLIFRNSSLDYVGFINATGDLCVETGDCADQNASCGSPVGGSFIIRNSTLDYVSYIDSTGDLCLVGRLYENADL